MEYKNNEQLDDIVIKVIDPKIAKDYTVRNHYMKTFPKPSVCFWVFYKKRLNGVLSFWTSTATKEKVKKLIPDIGDNEYIEMQRMNVSDLLWQNAESYILGQVYKLFKKNTTVKVLITHSGGCKNDCWIVYQSSSWLYFWKDKCNDFYLTSKWEYKNIVAPMRFWRVPKWIKWWQAVGEYLFWPWELIKSYRYTYLLPLQKWLRKYLEKKALAYPKDSETFRKNQEWIT